MKATTALWRSLRSLQGNQRACVLTEPMWAIPYQLFLPFASLYMSALGLSDARIGAVAALSLASQFFWALASGAIVDKIGRRKSMLVFGLLSWTLPCALWASARSFFLFALAAVLNGMWRVTGTSFGCMIVEDGDDRQLVSIYTILSIIALLAGFAAPAAGAFMARYSFVPTVRALYALALICMTAKFLVQYRMSAESTVGRQRMEETHGHSALGLALGGWRAFASALGARRMLLCSILVLLFNCDGAVFASFWPLFMAEKYAVSASTLSVLSPVRSVVTLAVYLLISPRVSLSRVRRPLLAGIAAKGLSLILPLAFLPMARGSVWVAFASAACDAFALAMLGPFAESLISIYIPRTERARVSSMLVAAILLFSAPVAWLAGQLAEMSRTLPLLMGTFFVAAEAVAALRLDGAVRRVRSEN